MLDYVRYYGEERIAGMHFVGAMTKLGSDAALAVLSPEVLALVPGFFARDAEQSVRSLEALIRMCFVHELPAPHLYTMLGYNASVPPFVRQAMFSRVLDNDDVLRTIRKPVLITQGADDAVVKIAAVEQHRAGVGHAQVHVVAGAGHAVFWEDAPAFNKRLAEFLREVATRDSVVGGTSFARADQ
jgi:pimeloyl-ACP methyl ester carboxylesterase